MAQRGPDREESKFQDIPALPDDAIPESLGGTKAAVTTASPPLAVKVDEDSGTSDVFYVGTAVIGSLTSGAVWRIKRITVVNPGGVLGVDIEWADGDDLFDNIYDNREALSYT